MASPTCSGCCSKSARYRHLRELWAPLSLREIANALVDVRIVPKISASVEKSSFALKHQARPLAGSRADHGQWRSFGRDLRIERQARILHFVQYDSALRGGVQWGGGVG